MPKYMFLMRGNCAERPEMSPADMEAAMQAWMQWMQEGQAAGWLLDPGSGLAPGGAVVQPDLTVVDGPFAESKELVGGYSLVQADNLEAACELAQRTMEIAGGGKIEVRPLIDGSDHTP